MKILIIPTLLLCGCSAMSPSTKVFEVARGTDKNGNPRAVSMKVFDSQADFHGPTEIRTKHLTVTARDGIIHSTAVREHWAGGSKVVNEIGSAGFKWLGVGVTGAVLKGAAGAIPAVVK